LCFGTCGGFNYDLSTQRCYFTEPVDGTGCVLIVTPPVSIGSLLFYKKKSGIDQPTIAPTPALTPDNIGGITVAAVTFSPTTTPIKGKTDYVVPILTTILVFGTLVGFASVVWRSNSNQVSPMKTHYRLVRRV
jgi:hypothetical protein